MKSIFLQRSHFFGGTRRRRGVTVVFFALAMVVLIGMSSLAVDYGLGVADANALQRGCDAAALGGVTQLVTSGTSSEAIAVDTQKARNLAVVLARRNGITVTPANVTFPAYNQIRVQATSSRRYLFAWVLGLQGGQVTRHAAAGKMPLSGVGSAVPIAMTTDDYHANKDGRSVEYELIRNHDEDFEDGTIVALDLRDTNQGKSPAVFEADLTNGYDGTVHIGQEINNALNADLASQGKRIEDAFDKRFEDAAEASYGDTGNNYTYPNYPPESRRIVMMIVADPTPADNSNPHVTARFFVPVYVESYRIPNNKSAYLRYRILPGYSYGSQNPDIVIGNANTPFTGVSANLLLQ